MSLSDRKKETVVAPEWCGRDAGKVFFITEMAAYHAEKWAWSMVLALKGTDGFIPDEVARLGMVGVAIRGINAFLASDPNPDRFFPLLDQMMTCVQIVRDPKNHPEVVMPLATAAGLDPYPDIADPATFGFLRSEVLRVHTNFSFIDAMWKWLSEMSAKDTSTTPTSLPA